jgi:hypothetical protein
MIGSYAIVFGAILIGLGFRLKGLKDTNAQALPSRG